MGTVILPTAPSISDILLVSPTPSLEISTGTPPTKDIGFPTNTDLTLLVTPNATGDVGSIHLIVVALERAYVVVTVDGLVKFDGRIVPGTAYAFDGSQRIEVLTANGAAVKILYNNSDLGIIGTYGQIVDLIFSSSSIMTPTSTSTPTPTASPIPSSTPKPSATLHPSITP
jgi:hypothetical protein